MYNLLVLGPLPPPLTGTPVSFNIFCEHAKKSPLIQDLIIVDASPKHLKQQKSLKFSLKNFKQAASIIYNFSKNIKGADSTIIFGSNGYVVSLAPILLCIAKFNGKKCYFRAFGGSLDQYIARLKAPLALLALTTLRNYSGVIVQTVFMQNHFSQLLNRHKVYHVAGYRQPVENIGLEKKIAEGSKLKIVFVGIVKQDKGILVLLEAMQRLSKKMIDVELTVYGNIHEPTKDEFERLNRELSNTKYAGVLDWRKVIETLADHDLLVLPTFYHSEGHPGVLIEAMMAGIPIISTNFRSIPEIVKHDYNGLLVTPSSVSELTDAIERLALDRDLLSRLAYNNSAMSQKFTAEILVNKIIAIASPEMEPSSHI